ncbi:MAG: histidine kinase [Clostridia bacterium]
MRYGLKKLTGWFRASLSPQFIALILIMGVLVVAVSATFISAFFTHTLVESIQAVETSYMGMQAENISVTLHRYTQTVYSMAVDANLLSGVKKANQLPPKQRADVSKTLRENMLTFLDSMEVTAATMVLADGSFIFYSRVLGTREGQSWFANDNLYAGYNSALQELCARARAQGKAVLGSTPNRYRQAGLYFIHLACPMKDLYTREELGVLVLSFNSSALRDAANPADTIAGASIGVLTDQFGTIVAHPDSTRLGFTLSLEGNQSVPGIVVPDKHTLVLARPIGQLGMQLYRLIDRDALLASARQYTLTLLLTLVVVVGLVTALMLLLLRFMMRSIRALQNGIYVVSCGELDVQVPVTSQDEIGQIALAFNYMTRQLSQSKQQEREQASLKLDALNRLRSAEIRSLENQINSHFLYNTLNTINFTAIKSGNINVSNQLKHLSQMLRYTFEKSDGIVAAQREADWLSDYLTLQSLRFGSAFDYSITLAPGIEDWPMRKLLLQPFIENCVLHGFQGIEHGGMLSICFQRHSETHLRVTIRDNGHGMSAPEVARLNALFRGAGEAQGEGIGLDNVSLRIRSYYGDAARVFVRSWLDEGTVIVVLLPRLNSL